MTAPTLALLALASLAAGFIDAVVGGGGLITMPALLLGLPAGTPFPTILGTNKVVACTGTTMAAGKFLRSGVMRWQDMVGPVLASMAGASGGVALAYFLQGRFEALLRPMMLVIMVAMLAFTLLKPDLGHLHAPKFGLGHQRGWAMLISLCLGFYDGFFGPGTGSVLIFLFVAVLGFDFLRSSALAKSVNWASNIAAMSLFLWKGSWIPMVALSMAVANGIGGYLGAHVALEKGSSWVRAMFITVVGALIVRLGWQVWAG
ncbi:MAG: TSUP family transporter [Holophagaceae bacterium]|nr:TSUP family transporter [Holophagaceae bacterium]